jgi:hypothetical protein
MSKLWSLGFVAERRSSVGRLEFSLSGGWPVCTLSLSERFISGRLVSKVSKDWPLVGDTGRPREHHCNFNVLSRTKTPMQSIPQSSNNMPKDDSPEPHISLDHD